MKVIAVGHLLEAKENYPGTADAINGWLQILTNSDFHSAQELTETFPRVTSEGDFYYFPLASLPLQICARIDFPSKVVLVNHVQPARDIVRRN